MQIAELGLEFSPVAVGDGWCSNFPVHLIKPLVRHPGKRRCLYLREAEELFYT